MLRVVIENDNGDELRVSDEGSSDEVTLGFEGVEIAVSIEELKQALTVFGVM